jgi:hypothetical protein
MTSTGSCPNTRGASRGSRGFAVLRREANEGGYFRPIVLERLLLLDREGKVGYGHGENGAELETTDYLEFIARVISHIPEKGQVMVRYYGPYANAHRGKVRKADRIPALQGMIEEEPRPVPSKGWAEMIRRAAGIFFFCEGKG